MVDARMSAIGIVVEDVSSGLFSCLPTTFVIVQFEFGLDRSEATFHECVVVAVGCPVHALQSFSATQHGSIFVAGILSAAISVMNQSGRWLSFFNG